MVRNASRSAAGFAALNAICENYLSLANASRRAATLAGDMDRTPQAHVSLAKTLPALMRERSLTYRALAARTQSLDHAGTGLSYSHIANLAAGRELPSRRALDLLARACGFPVSYFAEYRLAELRRQLDEREVGFATAYRTYQALSRLRPLRAYSCPRLRRDSGRLGGAGLALERAVHR
jgi:transcriptional regulator with XRE-family HTH domain